MDARLYFHSRGSGCESARRLARVRALSEGEFLPLFPPAVRRRVFTDRSASRMTRRTKDDEKENVPHARSRPQSDYTAPLVPVHELYGAAPTCVGLSSGGEIPDDHRASCFRKNSRKGYLTQGK